MKEKMRRIVLNLPFYSCGAYIHMQTTKDSYKQAYMHADTHTYTHTYTYSKAWFVTFV